MNGTAQNIPVVTGRFPKVKCGSCQELIDISNVEPFATFRCQKCGEEKKAPGRLGTFVLLDVLGRGGMGAVFRGTDPTLKRPVAVKVLLRTMGTKPAVLAQFQKEAQLAAQINHPNVAHIYAFGQEQGQPYIAMELVDGRPLSEVIQEEGQLPEPFVIQVALEIAGGLNAGDEAGLVHGDVKPENILLSREGPAKLIDFGLASFAEESAAKEVWGSPYYLPPEKVQRRKLDARSDIYSLGATLYYALAGRPPFEGKTAQEIADARLERAPRDLALYRRSISPEVRQTVMRMLRLNPAERYPNYASLIGDLQRAMPRQPNLTRFRRRVGLTPDAANALFERIGVYTNTIGKYTHRLFTGQIGDKKAEPVASPPENEVPSISAPIRVRKLRNHSSTAGRPVSKTKLRAEDGFSVKQQDENTMAIRAVVWTVIVGVLFLIVILIVACPRRSVTPLVPMPTTGTGVWLPPKDDSVETLRDAAVEIDVLANDPDPNLILANVAQPLHGTTAIQGRKILYTPARGFVGSDLFTYSVRTPAGKSMLASVSVAVTPSGTSSTPTPTTAPRPRTP